MIMLNNKQLTKHAEKKVQKLSVTEYTFVPYLPQWCIKVLWKYTFVPKVYILVPFKKMPTQWQLLYLYFWVYIDS